MPPRSARWREGWSRHHQGAQVSETAITDTGHLTKLVHRAEPTVLAAEFDDVTGQDGAHSREGVKLLFGRRTETDRAARPTPGTRRRTPRPAGPHITGTGTRTGSGSAPATSRTSRTSRTDHNLFAVGQQPRPVEPTDIRPAQHAARGPQGIDHPRPRRHPLNPGVPDLARDIDDQLAPRTARRAIRHRARG
ncbi:hypothetical protein Stube_45660 [Streptomyces tubercidicus]|uniref:Uncharacterized protein n=1 Tax=Streptomyces tubercidicus TaxID=47759 RepID=A0A640UV18_9ACTN|nr:hypothetical protein Stube_45660 [Streptomyces tubercidicus]